MSDAPSVSFPPPDEDDLGTDSLSNVRDMVSLDSLSVVFQPIVEMSKGRLFAYEALVRCSDQRLPSPPALLDEAVARGCVGRLGRLIREICVPWGSGHPLFVNIHPTELSQSWLVRPDDPIYEHDHEIYLEVTESVPMSHFELCHSVLSEVGSRGGVHLVVDDLGAGYSNLLRIADLEPAIVKLDRQLIVALDLKPRKRLLISAVVDLCCKLGAKVVAEGVETVDELSALRDTGVQYAQGYLLARPSFPPPAPYWPYGAAPKPPAQPTMRSPSSSDRPP